MWRSVSRAFTATTLAGFWRHWNPVYGYFLSRYCYRPLCRCAPRAVALVATFAFSGFVLHDLPLWPVRVALGAQPGFPFVTVAFIVMALAVLVTEALHLDLRRLPPASRLWVHALCIALAFCASIGFSRL